MDYANYILRIRPTHILFLLYRTRGPKCQDRGALVPAHPTPSAGPKLCRPTDRSCNAVGFLKSQIFSSVHLQKIWIQQ